MTEAPAPGTSTTAPSLARAIYGFAAFAVLATGMVMWSVINDRTAAFHENALVHAVEHRARGARLEFARSLDREWRALRAAAAQTATAGPETMRAVLDTIVADGGRVSRAVIAGMDGRIVAASRRALEGRDVSDERWFRQGLERASVTVIEEGATSDAARGDRFIQMVRPVAEPGAPAAGVVRLVMDMGLARRFLQETARALQLDLYLVDRDGEVIVATDNAALEGLDLRSLRSAIAGVGSEG